MAYGGKYKLNDIFRMVEAMGITDTATVFEISASEVYEKVSEYVEDVRKMIQDHELNHEQRLAAKLAEYMLTGSLFMELARYQKEVESASANEGTSMITNPNGESGLKTMTEKDESVQETKPVLGISTMSKDQESETSITESVLGSMVAGASGNMSANQDSRLKTSVEKEEAVKEFDPVLRTSALNTVQELKTSIIEKEEERGGSVSGASGGMSTMSDSSQESYLKTLTRKELSVQETTEPVLGTSAMTKDQGSDTSINESVSGTLAAGASGNMPTMNKDPESEPVLGTSVMNSDQKSIKIEKEEGGELVSKTFVAGAIGNMSVKESNVDWSRDKEVTNDERKSHEPASGTTISSSGEMSTMSTVAGRESEQGYAQQKQQSVNGSILVVGSTSSNQSVTEMPLASSGKRGISDERQEVGDDQSIQHPNESASSAIRDQSRSTMTNPNQEPPLMIENQEGPSSTVLGIQWPTLEDVKGLKKRGPITYINKK